MRRPPLFPRLLLGWFLPLRDREFILADLHEEYAQRTRDDAHRTSAYIWYWRQSLASLWSEGRYKLDEAQLGVPGQPGGSWFGALHQDTRHALRALNRRPVFSIVALLTLALGIGANTAIFSLVNWLLLRPLPGVTGQQELAIVEISREVGQSNGISWPNFADVANAQRSFVSMAGYGGADLQIQSDHAPPEGIRAQIVGGDYFGTLGMRMQIGRPINAAETVAGRPAHVVVINDALWQRLFQRDRNVIGKTVRANKIVLTVVGVTPSGFEGVERNQGVEAWVPLSIEPELRHASPGLAERLNGRRGGSIREMVARLRPGVRAEAAVEELQRILDQLRVQYPNENKNLAQRHVFVHPGIGVPILMRERTFNTVRLMLLVVSMLLLISSANVGNMLLVRGLQERSVAALRRALGASRNRIIGQQLAECMLLALGGGLLGLLVARAFLALMEGGQLLGLPEFRNVPLDWRVLAFTAAVSLGSGLLFTLAPARIVGRADPLVDLSTSSTRHTAGRYWGRKSITVAQIALSLALLIGAVMLTRTLINLQRTELGFDAERTAGIIVNAEPQGYQSAAMPALRAALLAALRSQPEIESAGLAHQIPFWTGGFSDRVRDPLARSDQPVSIDVQFASDGYLETLRIPIIRGRGLQPRDWNASQGNPVNVVLSEQAARTLFGDRDPIGQYVDQDRRTAGPRMFVVGVSGDSRLGQLHEEAPVLMYVPINNSPSTQLSAVMRARTSAAELEPVIRRALGSVDPTLPFQFHAIAHNVRNSLADQRLLARLLAMFSGLAVLLAAIGLYGILSYMVDERRREFGIRMALGAHATGIARLVGTEAAGLVLAGVLLGILGARWLSTIMTSAITGVTAPSVALFVAASMLFVLIATMATIVPTLLATRVEPSITLRQD
jgi:putative ABC transport system permease protein